MPFAADAFQEPVTRQPIMNEAEPIAAAMQIAPIAAINLFVMLFSTPVAVGTPWIKQPRIPPAAWPHLPIAIRRLA